MQRYMSGLGAIDMCKKAIHIPLPPFHAGCSRDSLGFNAKIYIIFGTMCDHSTGRQEIGL